MGHCNHIGSYKVGSISLEKENDVLTEEVGERDSKILHY